MAPDPNATLAELRRLYFSAAPGTIQRDFDRAIDLLKSLPSEADREKAAVYMEGLAELRKEWRSGRRR
jgi:hypothetical protein